MNARDIQHIAQDLIQHDYVFYVFFQNLSKVISMNEHKLLVTHIRAEHCPPQKKPQLMANSHIGQVCCSFFALFMSTDWYVL